MNVVSFLAPRKDHPFYQDYTPYLKLLDESCKRFGHQHYVITDDVSLPFNTFHCELPENLMEAILAGQLAYLESPLALVDSLLVGADCVLAQDPQVLTGLLGDIVATTHPFTDCILNTGAIFVRGGVPAAGFWREALEACKGEWGDDQKALARVLGATLEHGTYLRSASSNAVVPVTVTFVPVDPYNLAPNYPDHDCRHAVVLHFRGPRKRWMADYCHKWLNLGEGVIIETEVNTVDSTLIENIRVNSRRMLPWVTSVPAHEGHAVLVGGGPSLADTVESIRAHKQVGHGIFAINGAARYLDERDIRPNFQVVMDARVENVKFLDPRFSDAYLVSSQVNPLLFEALEGAEVSVFHPMMPELKEQVARAMGRPGLLIGGGITSGLTAMALAASLGYRKLHLYGYDSSDREDFSHPYDQAETEAERKRLEIWHKDKRYLCGFAMFKQAEAFPVVARVLADMGCEIFVYGDGLLPAIARELTAEEPQADESQSAA